MNLRKVLVLLVIFGFIAAAFASDGPEAEGPESESEGPSSHDDHDEVNREFKFVVEARQVEVEVKLENGGQESELRHKIEATDNGIEFHVAYQQESGDTETELRWPR